MNNVHPSSKRPVIGIMTGDSLGPLQNFKILGQHTSYPILPGNYNFFRSGLTCLNASCRCGLNRYMPPE